MITAVVSPTDNPNSWAEEYAHREKLRLLQIIISSLSILGSLTIIVTFFIFKELQTTTRKFLVFISVGDFFTVYPYLVVAWAGHEPDSMNNCVFQSMVTTTAVMWSFFWTSCLAIYLYIVIGQRQQAKAEKLLPYFHVISWGLPLALSATTWGIHMLGCDHSQVSAGWCWVRVQDVDHRRHIVWMLAAGKFWEIVSYFIDIILCAIVARKIKREVASREVSHGMTHIATRGMWKLILAPILFVFLRLWGTIRFLLFSFHAYQYESDFSRILIVCHIIGDSAQGFVYFMLYCLFTPKFREIVGKALCCQGSRTEQHRQQKAEHHKYLLQNPKSSMLYT